MDGRCRLSLRAVAAALGLGPVRAIGETSPATGDRFRLPDGRAFGVISATTEPFCRACDRNRLTADGFWYRCLYAQAGLTCAGRCAPAPTSAR